MLLGAFVLYWDDLGRKMLGIWGKEIVEWARNFGIWCWMMGVNWLAFCGVCWFHEQCRSSINLMHSFLASVG